MSNTYDTPSPVVDWAGHQFTVGDHLRKARNDAGLTAETLAQKLGVTRNTVLSYETDKIQSPQRDMILRWCIHTFTRPSHIHERYAFYDDKVFMAMQVGADQPAEVAEADLEIIPQWLEEMLESGSDASGWTWETLQRLAGLDPDRHVHLHGRVDN